MAGFDVKIDRSREVASLMMEMKAVIAINVKDARSTGCPTPMGTRRSEESTVSPPVV